MNPFPCAEAEVVVAMHANLEILVELLVIEHRGTLWTLGPNAFRNISFSRFCAADLWLAKKRGAISTIGL